MIFLDLLSLKIFINGLFIFTEMSSYLFDSNLKKQLIKINAIEQI